MCDTLPLSNVRIIKTDKGNKSRERIKPLRPKKRGKINGRKYQLYVHYQKEERTQGTGRDITSLTVCGVHRNFTQIDKMTNDINKITCPKCNRILTRLCYAAHI